MASRQTPRTLAPATHITLQPNIIEQAAYTRGNETHLSRLKHGDHPAAAVEGGDQLVLVGKRAEHGDVLHVYGGYSQQSTGPPIRALSKRLQRACFVGGGGSYAVEEHGGALDVKVRYLRQRLVQPSKHGAGNAGKLVQGITQQLGVRTPTLHLVAVARAYGGIEHEKNGVLSSAAVVASIHCVNRNALRFHKRDPTLRTQCLHTWRQHYAG